jgi:hypothetical protein
MSTTPGASDDFSEFWDPEELETGAAKANGPTAGAQDWGDPDMGVLRLHRRPPPVLPIEVFGDKWGSWITEAARAACAPADYVALPLLATVSTLIGNARWAQAAGNWSEPPHLWMGAVGDSGDGKSPGTDCLFRNVLPELEHRMVGDFPERHREWQAAVIADAAAKKNWQQEQRAALKEGQSFTKPMPVSTVSDIEPERPRLRQNDVTVEQVAAILATSTPKGVMVVRDELVGWLDGMNAYHPAGRAFWTEAYGGRPYRVERRKHSGHPIDIPRLVVAVCGGTQPDRLAKLLNDADDGLLARIQWGWPDPIPFKLGRDIPDIAWAIEALDRLRELNLAPGDPPNPILTALTSEGQRSIEEFGQDMQERRTDAGGLLRSAFGKARGTALRLSLNLEWLWWCGQNDFALPPDYISLRAFAAAAGLVADYFMPMAERVFGDAGASETERNAATLARWIVKERPPEVHVRHLQREVRLPGLRTAERIKAACDTLVEADWLHLPVPIKGFGKGRPPMIYSVNPKLYGV